ncbi:hypothetical protein NFC81_03240 [Salinispirillum sp. LH 10-3-1]|uniref:Tetratricopeptide repeat protein n=1 Tax=Salinispirillum sp. LH 10-3-1 TaxID=2952525 RepID=A0AB38YHG3_9GAMM
MVIKVPLRRCLLPSIISGVLWLPLSATHATELSAELRDIQPLTSAGRYFAARDALLELQTAYPASSRLQLELALIHIRLKNYPKALEQSTAVLEDPELPDAVRVQVQLLYLSTRRQQEQQTRTHSLVAAQLQLSYLPVLELGQVNGSLRYQRNANIATLNMSGYPLYLGGIATVEGYFYNDTAGDTDTLYLDLSTGLQAQVRNLTLNTQGGVVVTTEALLPYAQSGVLLQLSQQVAIAYRLKGIWYQDNIDPWQHRITGYWTLNDNWSTTAQLTIEDFIDNDELYLSWFGAVTWQGPRPITVDVKHSEFDTTHDTQLNVSTDLAASPNWTLRPSVGYWATDSWQGWRFSIGTQWTI